MLRKRLAVAAVILFSTAGLVALSQTGGGQATAGPVSMTAEGAGGYSLLRTALAEGRDVAVTVRFEKCATAAGEPGPVLLAGTRIGRFMSPGNQYITFSDVHETLDTENKVRHEYIKYRVQPDGAVSINTVIKTEDREPVIAGEYHCEIGSGAEFVWRR